MIRITLDTSVLHDMAEAARAGHAVALQLADFVNEGLIAAQLTTRFDSDVPFEPLRSMLLALPVAQKRRVGTLGRIGHPTRGDHIAGKDEVAETEQLMALVFPGNTPKSKRQHNRWADVDHLLAHRQSGADFFVTSEKAILAQAKPLKQTHKISVLSPGGALRLTDRKPA